MYVSNDINVGVGIDMFVGFFEVLVVVDKDVNLVFVVFDFLF